MKSFRYDEPQLFEAFIKSAQYLVRLKTQQDVWEHLARFIVTYFPADWSAFVQRDPVNGLSVLHCTLPEAVAARCIVTDEVRSLVEDVLDSGFLTSRVIPAPTPSMTAFLPVAEEHGTGNIMLVGHKTDGQLPKELLNVYLAIAGLAGTTFERLRNESELNRHRAHLEELVKARTAELEAANRELEAFSYSVSHDLRSPLRSITGFSQVLLEDFGEELRAGGKDSLDRIIAAGRRMEQLISDLLDLARVSRSELLREHVDLTAAAKEIAGELLAGEPGRKAEFVIADDIIVEGDGRLLYQMLENLLGNAWKFTAKNLSAKIEFGTVRDGGKSTYFVRDNGIGFDMAYAGKLFSPFQRLHKISEFPGTGIGLATVKRIVERHGGRVWVEAQAGKGAVAYFTLPRQENILNPGTGSRSSGLTESERKI